MSKQVGRKYDLVQGSKDIYTNEELLASFDKYRDLFGQTDFWNDKKSLQEFFNNLKINSIGMIPNYIVDNPNVDVVMLGNTMTEECFKNNKEIGLVGLDGFIYSNKNKYVKEKCLTLANKSGTNEPVSGSTTSFIMYNEIIDSGVFKLIIDYNSNKIHYSYFTNEEIMEGYKQYEATYPVGFDQFKFEFAHGLDYPKVLKQTMDAETNKIVMSNNPLISNLPIPKIDTIRMEDRSKFTNMLNHMGMIEIYENANEGEIIKLIKEENTNTEVPKIVEENNNTVSNDKDNINSNEEIIGRIGELENEEKLLTEKLMNVVREKAELKLKLNLQKMNKEIVEQETNKIVK